MSCQKISTNVCNFLGWLCWDKPRWWKKSKHFDIKSIWMFCFTIFCSSITSNSFEARHKNHTTDRCTTRNLFCFSQTCSVWSDGVQFNCQGVVGLSVVLQSVAVAPAPIKEPLPTKNRSISQVQPQVFSHLTFLTLPATDSTNTNAG